jgi:hypothetical protein
MHISLNIKNESLSQKILDFLSSFKKEDIEIQTLPDEKKGAFSEFSGLWKDRDINIQSIRETAWKK